MFSNIQHTKVIVTGPQRSGTTICSRMIAKDTGLRLIDETAWGVESKGSWEHILKTHDNFVMQCPAMAAYTKEVPDDVLVVWMVRDLEDIIKSQERISWQGEGHEKKRYNLRDSPDPIAKIKYDNWPKRKPKHFLEVPYESLKEHPMWVEKEDRIHFGDKQTQ